MEQKVYKSMFAHEERFWWHCGMRTISEVLLRKFLPTKNGNSILDVGCGTGGMFSLLSRFGAVQGIDRSPEALLYARKRGLAEVRLGQAEHIAFPDATFDLINCNEVLYHASVDDKAACGEFFRVLKEGGIVFLREPALNFLRGSHDTLVWTRHRYSKEELRARLEESGFAVLKISYANFFLLPLAVAVRTVEKILGKKEGSDDIFKPPRILNSLFKWPLYLEAALLKYVNFPIGLSVLCVAQKPKRS